jgi:hypothetical protein
MNAYFRASRSVASAALALASVALALGAGEVAVRVVFRDLTTTSPIDSWFGLRWKREHLRRNCFGFRDGEFSPRKPPGVYPIVAIGDSFTAAMGIAEEERYTERLEAALRAGRGPTEVLNFANPGAELDAHVETLRHAGLAVAPDLVLLQWYPNDFEIGKQGQPRPRPLLPWPRAHRALFAHSALYAILDRHWAWLQVRLGLTRSWEEYLRERFGDPAGEGSRRATDALRDFAALARGADVPIAIVLFPQLSDRQGDEDPLAFLHERVLEVCAQESIPCVDLRAVTAAWAGNSEALRVNRFDHHASALLHRLAAERLLEALGPRWLQAPARERGGGSAPPTR